MPLFGIIGKFVKTPSALETKKLQIFMFVVIFDQSYFTSQLRIFGIMLSSKLKCSHFTLLFSQNMNNHLRIQVGLSTPRPTRSISFISMHLAWGILDPPLTATPEQKEFEKLSTK